MDAVFIGFPVCLGVGDLSIGVLDLVSHYVGLEYYAMFCNLLH